VTETGEVHATEPVPVPQAGLQIIYKVWARLVLLSDALSAMEPLWSPMGKNCIGSAAQRLSGSAALRLCSATLLSSPDQL